MYNICEECITDRALCVGCRNAPMYRDYPQVSLFSAYTPVCHLGYCNCVGDPAYILRYHPDWYREMWGDITPEEAGQIGCADCTEENCKYDDEDK